MLTHKHEKTIQAWKNMNFFNWYWVQSSLGRIVESEYHRSKYCKIVVPQYFEQHYLYFKFKLVNRSQSNLSSQSQTYGTPLLLEKLQEGFLWRVWTLSVQIELFKDSGYTKTAFASNHLTLRPNLQIYQREVSLISNYLPSTENVRCQAISRFKGVFVM